MTRFIDAHCHLDLFPSYDQAAGQALESNTAVIAVTTTPRAWRQNVKLAQAYPDIIPALGLHPQLVGTHSEEVGLFEEYLPEARWVGEIGLDASARFYPFFDLQREVFSRILDSCAREGGKVLTVHSVRSAKLVLDLMVESRIFDSDCKVVLHWFTGGLRQGHRALELGCYLPINGAMLEQHQHKLLLLEIPSDRLLTESDGPFSQALGGQQTPASMAGVVEELARMRAQPMAELQAAIATNFEHLRSQKS